jgi:hypothetical protein
MPKMTIYVPEELQESMDGVSFAAKEVNWSSIAQDAFRRECDRYIQVAKIAPKIRDAVGRLRRSKEKTEDSERNEGDIAGRKWAAEKADYADLVRLKQFAMRPNWRKRKSEDIGLVWAVFNAIIGWTDASELEETYDTDWCIDFWTTWTNKATDTFVIAFVEGALEVFEEVEPQL